MPHVFVKGMLWIRPTISDKVYSLLILNSVRNLQSDHLYMVDGLAIQYNNTANLLYFMFFMSCTHTHTHLPTELVAHLLADINWLYNNKSIIPIVCSNTLVMEL